MYYIKMQRRRQIFQGVSLRRLIHEIFMIYSYREFALRNGEFETNLQLYSSDVFRLQFFEQFQQKMALSFPVILNFIQHDLIENILCSSLAIISTNACVRENLCSYILQRQQQTLTNLAHQETFLPPQDSFAEDAEAEPLKEDSLMAVTQIEAAAALAVTSKTAGKQSGKSSKEKLKAKLPTEKPRMAAYKSLARELPKEGPKEGEAAYADSDYIFRLRNHKEAERERLSQPQTETRKQKPRPPKGQRIVFDYEGNFGRGKEPSGAQFEQEVLSSSIEMARQAGRGEQSDREAPQVIVPTRLLDRSVRERTDLRKDFEQPPQEKRQLILNSLKLSNSRTKLVFDGHTVTRQEEIENSPAVAPMRKRSSVRAAIIPANEQEALLEKTDLLKELSGKGREGEGSQQRSRMKTVASEGRRQRISTQNESLKKVMLTEVEERHFELPKRRLQRITTNITSTGVNEDSDLARIREKLNIRTINQKLPRILSRYSKIQQDILKELRKKSKV